MFNEKSNTTKYVERGMMLGKDLWGDGNGESDALWRTGMAYITYSKEILKNSIISCFRKFKMINKKKHIYQGSRCFDRFREDDVSRDQTISALCSLKFNNNIEELKEIGLNLPFKLSRRFLMGPTLWIWIRAVCGKGKFYTFLFGLFELIEFLPSVLWNKFLRLIMGWNKTYSQEWYCDVEENVGFWSYENDKWVWKTYSSWVNNGHKLNNYYQKKSEENWFFRMMKKLQYPNYALYLTSWLVYVSDKSIFKKLLMNLITWESDNDNLLIRMLAGKKVSLEDINNYKPMNGFRWNTRLNKIGGYYYCLEDDNAKYNVIDKDILYTIYNKNKKNIK